MSNCSHSSEMIWVGDLDGFIDLDEIGRDYIREQEEAERREEYEDIGRIYLFNEDSILPYSLSDKRISAAEWRWAKHQSERKIISSISNKELEKGVVRTLLSLGRPYAIARYAKWESVPYPSALTASLPLGFRALFFQYLTGQGLHQPEKFNGRIRDALNEAVNLVDITAYHRTSIVQSVVHEIANETNENGGLESLDREATRTMLSLARLHFSIAEINLDSFADMEKIYSMYIRERESENSKEDNNVPMGRRYVHNWRLRHLRPLTDLFPFSIRHALERGISQLELNGKLSREICVNELALAHCEMLRMKKSYKKVRNSG